MDYSKSILECRRDGSMLSDSDKVRMSRAGKRVEVYYNSRRRVLSVRDVGGKVIGYVRSIKLRDVTFHVNQRGRQRVVDTGAKNLHAWVRGTVDMNQRFNVVGTRPAYYNPFKFSSFVEDIGHECGHPAGLVVEPVTECEAISITDSGATMVIK